MSFIFNCSFIPIPKGIFYNLILFPQHSYKRQKVITFLFNQMYRIELLEFEFRQFRVILYNELLLLWCCVLEDLDGPDDMFN